MKTGNVLMSIALILGIFVPAYVGYNHFVLTTVQCQLCRRKVDAHHQSLVQLTNGKKIRTCCPRCAVHYDHTHPGQVTSVLLVDRSTGQQIKAAEAIFVEGSDERSCLPTDQGMLREPGVNYDRLYDRCLPNLVAFRQQAAARDFKAHHGGRLLTYQQAVESVTEK